MECSCNERICKQLLAHIAAQRILEYVPAQLLTVSWRLEATAIATAQLRRFDAIHETMIKRSDRLRRTYTTRSDPVASMASGKISTGPGAPLS